MGLDVSLNTHVNQSDTGMLWMRERRKTRLGGIQRLHFQAAENSWPMHRIQPLRTGTRLQETGQEGSHRSREAVCRSRSTWEAFLLWPKISSPHQMQGGRHSFPPHPLAHTCHPRSGQRGQEGRTEHRMPTKGVQPGAARAE